jgi:hypothetical protein
LSWLGDIQQQPVPKIVVADGGEQQQVGILVILSFFWKTLAAGSSRSSRMCALQNEDHGRCSLISN